LPGVPRSTDPASKVTGKPSSGSNPLAGKKVAGATVPRRANPASGSGEDFFGKIQAFFKPLLALVGIAFGFSGLDNAPYEQLLTSLRANSNGSIENRANYLYGLSGRLISAADANIKNNLNPWTGLPLTSGIPMSSKQQFLAGGTPEQTLMQHYYNNCGYRCVSEAIRDGYEIWSYTDIDNTRDHKNLDPEDTNRFQADEHSFWGNEALRLGPRLRIQETALTARGPFDTLNGVIPEALDDGLAYALLNGGVSALYGLGEDNQLEGLSRTGLSTLTGSVQHEPGKPLKYSAKVMRLAYFYEFLEDLEGPRFNGKTFINALTEIVRKHGCCYFEPKALPKYLVDTYRATGSRLSGEVYMPHYKEIVKLKKEYVDNALKRGGITEQKAWENFAEALRKNVDEGKSKWQTVDLVKDLLRQNKPPSEIVAQLDIQSLFAEELKTRSEPDVVQDLISDLEQKIKANKVDNSKIMLRVRQEAYNHVRLAGADKPPSKEYCAQNLANDYDLICKESEFYNPEAFWERITRGVLIAPVVHFVNRHGTPIKEVPDEIIKFFEQVSNDHAVRRYVAKLNHRAGSTTKTHPDIMRFTEKGVKIFKEQGVPQYLNWRLLQHFEDNYSYADEKTNFFKKPLLKNITLANGKPLFVDNGKNLEFSKEFAEESINQYKIGGFNAYREFVRNGFQKANIPLTEDSNLIETFLPTLDDYESLVHTPDKLPDVSPDMKSCSSVAIPHPLVSNGIILERMREMDSHILHNCTSFYPNQMFSINNKRCYDNRYSYNKLINLVLKIDPLNPLGQYYLEIQPAFDKGNALPHPIEIFQLFKHEGKKIMCHAAGDSKSDIGMLARALESGGYADVVFNQIRNVDIFEEIISQRIDYVKDFKNFVRNSGEYSYPADVNGLYQQCCKKFGFFALEKVKVQQKGQLVEKYMKVTGFDQNGKTVHEQNPETSEAILYNKDDILNDLKQHYQSRIIHNTCPEAYLRRRAEYHGAFTGEDIELNPDDCLRATALVQKLDKGEVAREDLNPRDRLLLRRYERIARERLEGYILPQELPRFNVYYEWHDPNGNFVVYRSRKAGGKLVIDRKDGKPPQLFIGGEEGLSTLVKYEITRGSDGKFYLRNEASGIAADFYDDLNCLNDHVIEDRFLSRVPEPQGFLANQKLIKLFGKDNLKTFIQNLPLLFNGLLKYSGLIMAAGGLVRMVSPILGGLQDTVYKSGYWMSNSLRAVSAFGGLLRGELNVHKYHNIAFGELINIVSSFMPNGPKHLGLGLGNFVLFLGRGQQAAQRQQRVNNHTKDVLKGDLKPEQEVDPRPFVRRVTELGTGILLKVKEKATKEGLSAWLGEVVGNVGGGFLSTVQFVKDIFKDPRLILQYKDRRSEKSGSFYKSIPSAGHLLTVVGALSGIGAALAGTFGRSERFGDKDDNGFNRWGNMFIALANAVAAPGILFNAKEIMANTGGLPKLFKGLNGKDMTYNPVVAGVRQMIASLGFLLVPWFGLHNKYVASLFDIVNGVYFLGAAEEEKPNTTALGINILRKAGLYTDPEKNYKVHQFESSGKSAAA